MWMHEERRDQPDRLPNGIKPEEHSCMEGILSISFNGGFVRGRGHSNTFEVEAKHEKLSNALGVRFNVETVPASLKQDLNKDQQR